MFDCEFDYNKTLHGYEKRKNKMRINKKNINKFYVGASHIGSSIASGGNGDWTHKTIEEAIKHGKDVLESEDRECVIIVKIVKIIHRSAMPVIVEDVK